MSVDETARRALQIGRELAEDTLAFRARALGRRAAAVERASRSGRVQPPPSAVEAPGGAGSAGLLVAEGDSWFDYPWNDVLSLLEDDHAWDVESLAHRGDRVEEMAYGGGQLEEFTRRLEKILRRRQAPTAILLSGGGNDIAGDEFGMLLNHVRSSIAGFNDQIVTGVVDHRVRMAYLTIVSAVTRVCETYRGHRVPILVHGYDYPVPDGRGYPGGWWLLPGPWLEPGFREKGFDQLSERIALMRPLIDRFNTMLRKVANAPGLSHVRYIDLRGTLAGPDYQLLWANELHPTRDGFSLVAQGFADALAALP